MTNEQIARRLRIQAAELSRHGNNLYRVRAFRQAAIVVQGLSDEVEELLATRGRAALQEIPGIGKSLATTIASYFNESREPAGV